jgi:hypothetical protein
MNPMPTLKILPVLALVLNTIIGSSTASAQFVQFDRPDTTAGYLARLLVNETPFPGERAYESEADTKGAMLQVLWVLNCRLRFIPKGYTQQQVAGVRSGDIIDVITGTGGRRQCEGFYRNAAGQFVTEPRVEERLDNLLQIANSGGKPGRFDLDQQVVVSHEEALGSNRFLTRYQVSRTLFNCLIFGQRITVSPYVAPGPAGRMPGGTR